MRFAASSEDYTLTYQPLVKKSEQSCATEQAPIGLQSFRNYLPPWLGGRDVRAQSLTGMLSALKTASESYLEASLSTVAVITPFRVSDVYLDALHSACSSLFLKRAMSTPPEAGVFAALARGIGGQCDEDHGKYDPEQFVLTIDYSRAALTAIIFKEECNIFESWRAVHNMSLGTDNLSKVYDMPGSKSSREELADTFRELTSLPSSGGGDGASLKHIRHLALVGESANDKRLHDALKEVLLEQYHELCAASNDKCHSSVSNPLFAASRGAALYRWSQIEQANGQKDVL